MVLVSRADAVFHPAPHWSHGHGWIALQAGQGQVIDAVWYLPAGAHLNGQRLDRSRFVWGSRFQHQTDITDDLAATDRKSTRLNSSHPSISYAVFCLKKK